MRDLALTLSMLFFVPASLRWPAAGLLCWEWFGIMSPHREVYSFAYGQPFNSVIAVATLLGWLISRERKRWPADALPWVLLAWFCWMTFNMLFVPEPDYAWPFWNRVARTLVPVFLSFVLLNGKARLHGMVWVLIISLSFYGVKGGAFTIREGGHAIVFGPPDTVIYDNNQLAIAVVMELPLLLYLAQHTQRLLLRLGLLAAFGLQIVMVFGSYSRGGVIALTAMLGLFWLRSRHKIVAAVIGVAVVGAGLSVMPDSFWQRMNTLHNVDTDASFQGRVMAWQVAFRYATEHFPFGAGFYTPQLARIFNGYFPGAETHAAHSIYFQILGEHGFPGLLLYVLALWLGLRNAGVTIRATRDRPELAWAHDLAEMTRISLLAFYVGGAALSVAYFDGYLVLLAMTSTLRELVVPRRVAATAAVPLAAPLA